MFLLSALIDFHLKIANKNCCESTHFNTFLKCVVFVPICKLHSGKKSFPFFYKRLRAAVTFCTWHLAFISYRFLIGGIDEEQAFKFKSPCHYDPWILGYGPFWVISHPMRHFVLMSYLSCRQLIIDLGIILRCQSVFFNKIC